jgi:hypothetical protein
MEDVLDIYELPYNPDVPVVCMDEKPYQLPGEIREPMALRPGDLQKIDSEYVRKGTSSIFVFTEVLAGWRHVSAREHRAALDWAEEICYLLEECYPDKEKLILVMDNLNTHAISSLYKRYQPENARALAKRLEIHYTPKHGSWLNIAEIELNAITRQCLARRINTLENLQKQLGAWEQQRNNNQRTVIWQFKTADARIKLLSLYPKLE